MSSLTYGFHLCMVHHSTNRAACVEHRGGKAHLDLVHLPLYGLRYLRGLICFWARMVSFTKQELGGETSTNSQPKVLPSWLVVHNWLLEELQGGFPHLFRGLNITRSFEK